MNFYYAETMNFNEFNGIVITRDHQDKKWKTAPWNDYGFESTFNIFYVIDNGRRKLGQIKILINGYEQTAKGLKNLGEKTSTLDLYKLNEPLEPKDVVSLATDIEYYKKLNKVLGDDAISISKVLEFFCDAGLYLEHLDEYRTWTGFSESLLRDGSSALALVKKGAKIAQGGYEILKEIAIDVNNLPDTFEPIQLTFNTSDEIFIRNISILIGSNGVGKTHILEKVIETVSGLTDGADNWYCFNKLLVTSYSPFENFKTKKQLTIELEKRHAKKLGVKYKKKTNRINEYAYLGYKDQHDKFNLDWPKQFSAESVVNIIDEDKSTAWYRVPRIKLLMDTLKITLDFDELVLIKEDGSELIIDSDITMEDVFSENFLNITTASIDTKSGLIFRKEGNDLNLSSGQVMYTYIIPGLISEIVEESLIILDEPEIYLHPALEIGLIRMIKYLLKSTKSYAVIATHSPVIAREIHREQINVISRNNGLSSNNKPVVETYGESLDQIIGEVFADNYETKPYESELKKLAKKEGINKAFERLKGKIGDDALIYLTSNSLKLEIEGDDDEVSK